MKFIDEVTIQISSGAGGKGASSFRREKHVAFGGPDGGHGGNGGSVILKGDENLNTLLHFRGKKLYQAEDGENGMGSQRNGAYGEDLILRVPVGTLIYDADFDNLVVDITEHDQEFTILEGGRGGLGNSYFKSSTNQAPTYAQEGEEGKTQNLKLELKLMADIGLVGLPNAGKSTLISSISHAKPKIADYPFTTLEPNLGVVKVDEENTLVVADIPGLIEDASTGKGLGLQFLKHIERTHALVHLIDCAMLVDPYEAIENYAVIRKELESFSETVANKKEIVCLSKMDAMQKEEKEKFIATMQEHLDKKVIPISSVSGENLDLLKRIMLKTKKIED